MGDETAKMAVAERAYAQSERSEIGVDREPTAHESARSMLSAQISELESSIERLADRIAPVLDPGVDPGPAQLDAAPRQPHAPVTSMLEDQFDHVQRLTERVQGITRRVDL